MAKGPAFREGNARRHQQRLGVPRWTDEVASIDVNKLRIQLQAEAIRDRGGLTAEERAALRQKVSEVQKQREKKERRLDLERGKYLTRPGLFLCGCDPQDPHIKTYYTNVTADGQQTNKRYNARGVEVCPQHGVPMYGFMSDAAKVVGNGKAPSGQLGSPDIVDIRDIRDPTEVGHEHLARQNGHGSVGTNG